MTTMQHSPQTIVTHIDAIEDKMIVNRHLSVKEVFEHTRVLSAQVKLDYHVFEKVSRYDCAALDTLHLRLEAFMTAYGEYESMALNESEVLDLWQGIEGEAYRVKRRAIYYLKYIFEEDKKAAGGEILDKIAVEHGHHDLTLDFIRLSDLVQEHSDALLELNFTTKEVQRVSEIADTLLTLLGSITGTPEQVKEKVVHLQKAYTYLHHGVDSIRRMGKVLFFEDAERLAHYKYDVYSPTEIGVVAR